MHNLLHPELIEVPLRFSIKYRIDSLFEQHVHQADQWKTDQGIRDVAFQLAQHRDTERFGLEAAGAVVGLVFHKVLLDMPVREPDGKMHFHQ